MVGYHVIALYTVYVLCFTELDTITFYLYLTRKTTYTHKNYLLYGDIKVFNKKFTSLDEIFILL